MPYWWNQWNTDQQQQQKYNKSTKQRAGSLKK
jgi:hypothetical protein